MVDLLAPTRAATSLHIASEVHETRPTTARAAGAARVILGHHEQLARLAHVLDLRRPTHRPGRRKSIPLGLATASAASSPPRPHGPTLIASTCRR